MRSAESERWPDNNPLLVVGTHCGLAHGCASFIPVKSDLQLEVDASPCGAEMCVRWSIGYSVECEKCEAVRKLDGTLEQGAAM